MKRGLIGFILLLGACSFPVFSQEMIPGFSHRHWTVDDGLPINEVLSIEQTSERYLWLSTFDGLVRFDGNRFVTFNKNNTPSLVSNRLETLKKGLNDELWFGLETIAEKDYLVRFKDGIAEAHEFAINRNSLRMTPSFYKDEEFRVLNNYQVYSYVQNEFVLYSGVLRETKIYAISSSYAGGMWVSTDDGILKIVNGEIVSEYTVNDGLSTNIGRRLFEDSKKRLWVNSEFGIDVIQDGKVQQIEMPENSIGLKFVVTEGIEDLSYPGRIIYKISDEYKIVFLDGETQLIPPTLVDEKGKLSDFTLLGGEDLKSTNSWMFTKNMLFNNGELVFENEMSINGILEDNYGGVWVAMSDGLYHFRKNLFDAFNYENSGLRNIYPVHRGVKDAIWAGDLYGEIYRYQENEWSIIQKILSSRIFSFHEDTKGNIWAGDRIGLLKKEPEKDALFERVSNPSGFPLDGIKAIYENTKTNEIWFGGIFGIFRRDNSNRWTHIGSTSKGEKISEIRTINKTRKGDMWFGTNGAGLFYKKNGEVFSFEGNDKLSDNIIRSFYEDEEGIIWVGFENGGLNRIELKDSNPNDFTITWYNKSNGLFDNVVHVILEDEKNRLWMSSNRGIFWVSKENLNAYSRGEIERIRSTYYLNQDGLPGNEANGGMQSTGLVTDDGNFWFSMVDGIAIVNPDEVLSIYEPTPTIIEGLSINDSTISNFDQKLILEKDQRDIQFTYTGMNYGADSKNIQFRYRLNGTNNNEWISAGNRREAFFTNLSSGEYTFAVQASIDGNRWESSESTASFIIPSYFYESIWFSFFMMISGVGLLYSGFRWRTRQLLKRQDELTSLVNEQTKDLIVEKQEVERQKETIEKLGYSKDRFFANISHELRTPLTLVLGPLKQVQDSGEFRDENNERLLSIAGKNGRRLQELVEQVLDVTRLDTGTIQTDFEILDILEYLKLISESFESQSVRKEIDMSTELPPGRVLISADRDKIQKIIINLISNALKFTPNGGRIKVVLKEKEEEVEFIVKDTGIGIEPDRLALIFDRFHSNDSSSLTSGGGLGIGLHLTKELVDLHHGTIKVESELGKGTTFTINLPKKQDTNVTEGEDEIPFETIDLNHTQAEVVDPVIIPQKKSVTTILLLEDNQDMRLYISGLLTTEDVEVIEAGNGIEGQKRLAEVNPDLIITDVMMPGMDGFEFAKFVRSKPEYRLTPLVMLTALSSQDDRIQAFDIGVSDYLNKPFNERELKARITNLLALKVERDEAISYIGEDEEADDAEETQKQFIAKLRVYIKERIGEPEITAEELCLAVNMSRRQLFRKIKTETGFTPGGFVRELKLLEARALIEAKTMKSISATSTAVGFSSATHFTKIFEERFGVHPKELMR